jgi:hypothetical protein
MLQEQQSPMSATRPATFARCYLLTFIRPWRTFDAVVAEPRRVRWGFLAVGITALDYGLVYFFLARNGGRPTVFTPWLDIPAEVYYRWDQFFIIPSILLAWVAAAGFTHLASRALGGSGSFEDTLSLMGFGLSTASWWTGLHDLVTTFLGFIGVIDQRRYEDLMSTPTPFRTFLWVLMTGYAVWFFVTFTAAAAKAHRLHLPRAIAAGAAGVVVYNGVFVLFNR